jgi:site-specific recombinase XerD
MTIAEAYLGSSQVFRRLKNGPHGQLIERYAARLVEDGLARHGTWRCLNMVGGLLSWMASHRIEVTDLNETRVERYIRDRGNRQTIQPGDRAALKRWLSVLRITGTIAPALQSQTTPHDQIFAEFGDHLQRERGLSPKSIVRHLPFIRQFLREVCPAGESDLGEIRQEAVIAYIERHARDWSPSSGKAMCSSLRTFLRYLHHQGLHQLSLAGCVPSIRRWKLSSLPSYLSSAQVQKVLVGCDRATAMGRRDYAILMMLAKLGLRADEVATLMLDDIDWYAGEMLLSAKGRQRARMPIPPDVGAAVVAYLRGGRPTSSARRLFLRTPAPHTGLRPAPRSR